MSFDKKFNIKKLVKISAVALAMISAGGVASTVNANTNVHADDSAFQKQMAYLKAGDSAMEKRGDQDETHAEIEGDRSDPSALAEDIAYNKSFVEKHKSQLMSGLSNKTKSAVKKQVEADDGDTQPDTSSKSSDSDVKMPSIFNVPTHNTSKESTSRSKVAKSSKRAHLSKAMVRRIMRQIRLDKKAIRHDNHYLSTRNGKKFTKLMNRSKRAQKRAMHVKGAKRYARYYKDEVKHEKDLVRLTKSTHASKVTKRNARRSLKKLRKSIRKNQKYAKRAHKVTRHKHSRSLKE